MSYEDLQEHNVFLPESVWGEVDLSASVNQAGLAVIMGLGVLGCLLMWWGHGTLATWVGCAVYIAFLYVFTFYSNAGIESQNKDIDRLIEEHR